MQVAVAWIRDELAPLFEPSLTGKRLLAPNIGAFGAF